MALRFEIDPAAQRPIYAQIIDEVHRGLTLGVVGPGDRLPSVRELAGELEVNPNTVRQAYTELGHQGVLETRRGRGTFIAQSVERPGADARSRRLGELAEEALRRGYRHGFGANELLAAIERVVKGAPGTGTPVPRRHQGEVGHRRQGAEEPG